MSERPKVVIELSDGTTIEAIGKTAEEMIRRALDWDDALGLKAGSYSTENVVKACWNWTWPDDKAKG